MKGGEAYALLLKGKVQVRSVVGEGAALASFEGPKRQLCMASDDEGILLTGPCARIATWEGRH